MKVMVMMKAEMYYYMPVSILNAFLCANSFSPTTLGGG